QFAPGIVFPGLQVAFSQIPFLHVTGAPLAAGLQSASELHAPPHCDLVSAGGGGEVIKFPQQTCPSPQAPPFPGSLPAPAQLPNCATLTQATQAAPPPPPPPSPPPP